MSRRRKSTSSTKKSSENATDQESDEWSEEEKKRLLDALKRDDGKNNWRWITRQVSSKTMNQVKEFAEKLRAEKQTATARRTSSSSKRPIAPKDTGPLEGWINATKRLRGDNDVDGTCIPQIMTIAAMEPVQSEPGNPAPDYSQIYTLLSRVMREQPPPDLTPLDASVILDLLNDLERRLAGHDISSQVQFVVNKSKEIMATAAGTTGQSSSDAGSSSSRPKSQLFSLNPLNVPVQLLNLKKPSLVNTASKAAPETTKEQS